MRFTIGSRDLALVVAARSTSWLGDLVAVVAVELHLQGSGPGAVAAVLLADLLPILLLSGVAGRVVDRMDNRLVLLTCSLGQAAACARLAGLASSGAAGLSAYVGLFAALGAGQAFNGVAWQALVPAIAPGDRLARATAAVQAGVTISGVAAPAIGGLLSGLYGTAVPLLVDAGSFLVVAVAAVLVHTRRVLTPHPPSAQGGWRIVRQDPLLSAVVVLLGAFVLIGCIVNVADVFLVRGALHADSTWYGVLAAAFSAGALAGSVVGGRWAGPGALARAFVVAAVVLAAGLAGLGASPGVGIACVASVVAGLGNGTLNVALSALVMGRAAAAERGRVAAVVSAVVSATQLVAFVSGGALTAQLGPRPVFLLAGALGVGVVLALGPRVIRTAARAESLSVTAERVEVPA